MKSEIWLFLAGAMINDTDKQEDRQGIKWRNDACEFIKKRYDNVYPVTAQEFYRYDEFYKCDAKETLRFDMKDVRESDVILVNVKDLEKSLSTSDEIFYAYISHKPIYGFFEGSEEELSIHPWKKEQLNRIFYGKESMKDAISYIATHYVSL